MTEREKFEAWWQTLDDPEPLERMTERPDEYAYWITDEAWKAWQARAALDAVSEGEK